MRGGGFGVDDTSELWVGDRHTRFRNTTTGIRQQLSKGMKIRYLRKFMTKDSRKSSHECPYIVHNGANPVHIGRSCLKVCS
jgi:hypothetical protein